MTEVSFEYDQDPRYGWVRVVLDENSKSQEIIIEDGYKTWGFEYRDGKIIGPHCLCNAWSAGECACGLYKGAY